MSYSLNRLYEVEGISRQAVWEHFQRQQEQVRLIGELIPQIDARREEHPGEGLEKLYWQLQPEGIGRDKFCAIFGGLGYNIRRTRRRVRTTIPVHKAYANIIEGRLVDGPCQVWQSDITYIKIGGRFYYLVFIIDVYTRRIVGWAASRNMRAEANLKALKMALSAYSQAELDGCVHHSDRGTQYTDGRYLATLRSHGMDISMGLIATDNAFAERINGVIKNEYLIPWACSDYRELASRTRQAVEDYNTKRHHGALSRRSPQAYEGLCQGGQPGPNRCEMIRSERTPKILEASLQNQTTSSYPVCRICLN